MATQDYSPIKVKYGSERWLFSAAVPYSIIGTNYEQGIGIHLAQTCGNDVINGLGEGGIPEPATMGLVGLGLISLQFLAHRANRRLTLDA
jgi:hypothetical protein